VRSARPSVDSFILGTARLVTREISRPREQPVELDAELPCPLSETRPDLLELLRLGECLKRLAERDRTVVSLTFFHEQTADEIGEALGMESGNVRVTRHRALTRLRGCMGLETEEATA